MNDRIHIAYPSGHMDLVLSQFFPCTVREARIVFPLINTYAEAPEKEKLRQHLMQYANEKKESMKEMEADYQCGRRRSAGIIVRYRRFTSGQSVTWSFWRIKSWKKD